MFRRIPQLLWGLAVLFSLLGVAPAAAQAPASLDSLRIELWPEYDQPSVLVILAGKLSATTTPAEFTVLIPASSGGPLAVAIQDETGNLLNSPYTTAASGDKLAVTMQLAQPNFHMEYYDPALSIEGQARTYTFQWVTPVAVASADLRVQEPVGATNLSADPPLASAGPGEFGLNYYTASLGALSAGQTVSVRLTYSKATAALSAESIGGGVVVTPQLTAPTATSPSLVWPIVAAAGGALLIGIGIGVFVATRRREAPATQKPRTRRGRRRTRPAEATRPVARPEPADPAPAGYCTECGQALLPGDAYCRDCGTRVRS